MPMQPAPSSGAARHLLPLAEKDEIGARTVLSGAGAEALKLTFQFAWRDADCPNRVIACLPFSRAMGEGARRADEGCDSLPSAHRVGLHLRARRVEGR